MNDNPGGVETFPEARHVEVRIAGALVAATDRPVRLEQHGSPTRWYVPRTDVAAALVASARTSRCPFKGTASYWSIDVGGVVHDDIAWSYDQPAPVAAAIEGMLSFFPERADVSVGDV